MLGLGENVLFTAMCKSIHRLFGIEKVAKRFSPLKRRSESELHLRLADFCSFWAETGYFLQSATLYLRFSESKRRAKDFRGSNAAAKAWLRGGFRAPKPFAPPKTQKSSFRIVPKTVLRNRRATGARMGLVSK